MPLSKDLSILCLMSKIIVIAHDLRSAHNIGSLIRTADGLGVHKIYFTGYTPYPKAKNDIRLPHIANKIHKQIVKTSLGAENFVDWEYVEDLDTIINKLKSEHYLIAALEQSKDSVSITDYIDNQDIALILGREVQGIDAKILKLCDLTLEIPMLGKKESLNVTQAAAIALYQLRWKIHNPDKHKN